jgi:MFS transporter, YQGE family, putative transporter
LEIERFFPLYLKTKKEVILLFSSSLKKLLLHNVFFTILFSFVQLFMNLYIWQQEKQLSDLLFFNLFLYISWAIFYTLGTHLFRIFSLRFLFILSSVVPVISFSFLSFFSFSVTFVTIAFFGISFGMMFSLYAAAQSQAVFGLGKKEEFTLYFHFRSLFEKIIQVVIPLGFSLLILTSGYQTSFIILLFFSCFLFLFSFFVPTISFPDQKGSWSYHSVFPNASFRWLSLAMFVGVLVLEFQKIFVLVYTFTISDHPVVIAALATLYTLAAIASLLSFRKFSNVSEPQWMRIGVLFLFVSFLLFLFRHPVLIVLANLFFTIGTFFFRNLFHSTHYQKGKELCDEKRIGYLLWREIILCCSRILLLLALLTFVESIDQPSFLVMFGLVFLSSFFVPILHKRAGA